MQTRSGAFHTIALAIASLHFAFSILNYRITW